MEDERVGPDELGPEDAERETLGQEREGALAPSDAAPVRPDDEDEPARH